MTEIRKLSCGLRMVLDRLPYVQSVTTGIWVKAGCVDEENQKLSGISHFIEHMMFKGTSKRSARDIAADADALGAQMNAFTSKESTCYYIKSFTSNVSEACEILIDILTDSLFDPAEMAKEKQVVKEEMKMVEDSPDEDVMDLMYEELFSDEPLARSILGTPESLDGITHDDIKAYIAKEYSLDNIVVSVAGNFDADSVCEQFENALSCMTPTKEVKAYEPVIYVPSFRTKVKDIEQSQICIAARTVEYGHDDISALQLVSNIMGGSMSSRLFQNIREEKGLAYTVYSTCAAHEKDGFYAICAGVAHDKIEDTVAAIIDELETLALHGVTDKELETAKAQVKGGLIFSQESTGSRMLSAGKRALLKNQVKSLEELVKSIDDVTKDDISRVAAMITDVSTYSGALISKRDVDLSSIIK